MQTGGWELFPPEVHHHLLLFHRVQLQVFLTTATHKSVQQVLYSSSRPFTKPPGSGLVICEDLQVTTVSAVIDIKNVGCEEEGESTVLWEAQMLQI